MQVLTSVYLVESDNSVVDVGTQANDVADAFKKAKGRHVTLRHVDNGKSRVIKEKHRGFRLDSIARLG